MLIERLALVIQNLYWLNLKRNVELSLKGDLSKSAVTLLDIWDKCQAIYLIGVQDAQIIEITTNSSNLSIFHLLCNILRSQTHHYHRFLFFRASCVKQLIYFNKHHIEMSVHTTDCTVCTGTAGIKGGGGGVPLWIYLVVEMCHANAPFSWAMPWGCQYWCR